MSLHHNGRATPSPESSAPATLNAAPSLEEIVQLTRHELTTAQETDSIVECGRAALSLLPSNPDLCLKLAYQKLHDVPYREVKTCWRRLHADATLWKAVEIVGGRLDRTQSSRDWFDKVVQMLDMTLILTGAPDRGEVLELWFTALEGVLSAQGSSGDTSAQLERPAKRPKIDKSLLTPPGFPTANIEDLPVLRHQITRADDLSLSAHQKRLSSPATHTPLIIENAIQHWPALVERPWSDPEYLLKRTLGGSRLVPVETGRSYTDSGWGQKISTFRDFLQTYMLDNNNKSAGSLKNTTQTGYLAQHDLFAQIPSLRADISIPDLCYCDPAPNPLPHIKQTPKLEDPLLNAWFGPKGTISPLHTDPYHNILAQVVGYKYVRLYAPDQTERLYPRSVDESGVDMSNTSQVDLDEAAELCPEINTGESVFRDRDANTAGECEELQRRRAAFEHRFPGFLEAEYVEGVLGPGDCLYLPPGWWHYVRSLSPSFSVSFWFN